MDLHSTMVLFKLPVLKLQFLKKSLFTFHYGPIQITSSIIKDMTNKEFTFHYGPIQI